MRHASKYSTGAAPTTSTKRRANRERDIPAVFANSAIVHALPTFEWMWVGQCLGQLRIGEAAKQALRL
ncbi:hypothetical protein [Mesorhizobium sp. M7D.F.Ca.US.004.01.2.1]|uniref:hypothetical protein n=1 Tax=Mesorhizobium sp. M7D.F.Ca.US.004.01.2.1 TaxID=2496738 RepID=UPI001FE12324|nr:hypothetical protein [Mesorhizobium sp. M7D.F.Ca.US.004.01.2.1]